MRAIFLTLLNSQEKSKNLCTGFKTHQHPTYFIGFLDFMKDINLIQSAFDGYNVCICAYGQTGSGKTYTILGDDTHPGIAPRTFAEIFLVAEEMSQTYETTVSFYVLELYNDRLIDLLSPSSGPNATGDADKLEIRRDRRGTVWVSGARVLPAEDSSSLEKSFRQALTARHTASTRMNDRSSRSHLVVGLIIETTSKINGTVLRGKISLVDLAGSERTGKSGVSADTLREANAINKSLSAFGDVLNALTTDQAFVPYRNNKLTLLMQDSIGGNAKTLMFVNISPSSYNLEETIISLSYGQRLKQVTNGATRNAESREVARLKSLPYYSSFPFIFPLYP
ncbi:Kinesin-like calmodulin-binding protein [Orchesella cincta]|uniref:Kinesin-like protein n=1 Tax=Orchesella cincta TaxID=48709 RepID=A0A1D2NB72_ORCCI|nr:Kinesin-like calmodulin-binding protein [Orchesella cincta]